MIARYREAHRRLAAAQKSRKGGPAYSIYVNRPLGRRAAAAAHVVGLTPNGVTAISAVFSFSGIALIALGPSTVLTGIGVAALLVIGYALDAADGQLARLRGGGSVAGEWLDHMVDSGKVIALHGAVAIHLHRIDDLDERWLLVPLGYGVVSVVLFFAQLLNEQLARGRTAAAGGAQAGGDASVLVALLKLPHDYGFLCLLFVLLGVHEVFVIAYAAFFAANTVYLALASRRWFRQMQSLDAGAAT